MKLLAKPLAWLPSGAQGAQGAAFAATLGLVAIQVGIGIIMKMAQSNGGKYAFSPSASIAISEFLKMCLSCTFFRSECKGRAASGIGPKDGEAHGGEYAMLPTSRTEDQERNSLDENTDQEEIKKSSPDSSSALPFGIGLYWRYFRNEVSAETRYGFCNLALFYVLINNSIFVSYKMADPGTIQLTKSGVTLITALVMMTTLGTKVSKMQWIAIGVQLCGLVITQYNPETGTAYPIGTYLVLLFQVFLSASSGVYNQVLLKREKSSLHANNITLYAAGTCFNVLVHIVVSAVNPDEPGFLVGYNSPGAIMVIVSNVFIGLAITAVYKYADAVVKCFATAIATGILLYVSSILFGTPLGFLAIPGSLLVFMASWLYLDNPAPRDDDGSSTSGEGKRRTILDRFPKTLLVISTFVTILIIAWLTALEVSMPDVQATPEPIVNPPSTELENPGTEFEKPSHVPDHGIFESPFNNSVAMVRWNSRHPERIPNIMKYKPFFHTVHISMPEQFKDKDESFHNLAGDQYGGIQMHNQVATAMQLLLDQELDVDGLLYFHFDAWINPLRYNDMDLSQIWYPTDGFATNPSYRCMTDPKVVNWWGWGRNFHKKSRHASQIAGNTTAANAKDPEQKYTIQPDEFCLGWSDIYWIPRKYFTDYISLTRNAFGGTEETSVFHEVAIPTMLHIIDETYRKSKFHTLITDVGPCWGHCCADNPKSGDVKWYRCGHRLNYLDKDVTSAFYTHLGSQASLLGNTFE